VPFFYIKNQLSSRLIWYSNTWQYSKLWQ